jgi:hypothetical protein
MIFSICHQCQQHGWCTLSYEYLSKFSKKIETAQFGCSGAWGKLIREKYVDNLMALSLLVKEGFNEEAYRFLSVSHYLGSYLS